MNNQFSLLIEWSTEDRLYVVTFPEFPGSHTHGIAYEDAVKQGQEVLELLVETYRQEGRPLPEPAEFRYAVA